MNSVFQKDTLKDKVALITGGATGINFVVGKVLGQHGAKLVIMGRRLEVLQKAKEEFTKLGISSSIVQGDVRSVESAEKVVKETVNQYGKIDILVNGAAGNFLCPAENLSTNAFKTVVEIDLVGTFNMSRAAFTELSKTKGTVINISATLHYTSTPWQTHASAAKAGVDSLTRSMASEWGNFGIRVVGIAPGPIKDTEGASRLGLGPAPEELEKLIQQRVPLGKMGTKDDIGYAALFLSSSAANYITGTTLVVDGGEWLHREAMISREALQMLQSQRKKSKL